MTPELGWETTMERRLSKRFDPGWHARVEGIHFGEPFALSGSILNMSSQGALLSLSGPIHAGMKVGLMVKLPTSSVRWMKYSGVILRVTTEHGHSIAAVKFDHATPEFAR